jgi:hypothetical protein
VTVIGEEVGGGEEWEGEVEEGERRRFDWRSRVASRRRRLVMGQEWVVREEMEEAVKREEVWGLEGEEAEDGVMGEGLRGSGEKEVTEEEVEIEIEVEERSGESEMMMGEGGRRTESAEEAEEEGVGWRLHAELRTAKEREVRGRGGGGVR